jgi:hypothetical protein
VLRILPRGTSRWRSQQIALHPQEAAVDGACMQLSRLFRNTRIAPHLAALEHMEPSNAGTADMAAMIGPPVIFDRVYCCALRDHMQSLERLRLPLNPFLEVILATPACLYLLCDCMQFSFMTLKVLLR